MQFYKYSIYDLWHEFLQGMMIRGTATECLEIASLECNDSVQDVYEFGLIKNADEVLYAC